MNPLTFAETAEFYRVDAGLKLDPKNRAVLGQYMTPAPIGRFIASLFENTSNDMRVLDPGAGLGSLTAALVERLCKNDQKPRSATFVCYEIEPLLIGYLQNTLDESVSQCRLSQIKATSEIRETDFICSNQSGTQPNIFDTDRQSVDGFTHVIMNPPYKKINSASPHRAALRKAGIETSNLYTGFMFLAAQRLQEGGEMVAIVPRSFCNGPYFKPFRKQFFSMMALRHIHIFEKRNSAFKGDAVLQENLILHAVKGVKPVTVKITTSRGGDFELDKDCGECVVQDMTQRAVEYGAVIRADDPNQFVHIAATDLDQGIVDRMANFTATLSDIGLEVSTGPVVDFRLKNDLRAHLEKGAVPLLYVAHFQGGGFQWPKDMKKPNAIKVSEDSRRWLWVNEGCYVLTRRFTSKEERRRLVASIYAASLPGELIGFENHLNVFHTGQAGMPCDLATGLNIYLNSSLVDRYFRQFNGHTQVNATDLRSLRYPEREILERIGQAADGPALSQQDIDTIIEGELQKMPEEINPLHAQQKIDEALQILKALGMPKGQQNERSALTLLALLALQASGAWNKLDRPLMGITPIMDFTRKHYGREYAPNTRETFRRQTMHQFVEAGIALYNPDKPDRAVNSPKACYQISGEALQVILTFGTEQWETTLEAYLSGQETLAAKWANYREMQMIPVTVADGQEITLTPELASLFKGANPGIVYVTAFPDRSVMGRRLGEISWETEVWCADAPTHLIHFNGERFLGPYERSEA